MKLKLLKRTAESKSEVKRLRREGNIPAIIYVQGKAAETIAVNNNELASLMRQIIPGRLSTTVFTLATENGKERRVLIKDIQYNITTYDIIHLDFEELHDGQKVNVNVPIECTGVADCAGIKLGSVLRQVIRYIRIRCLPRDIPAVFELDVKELGPRESKRLKDLAMPNTIRPLADLNEVAVVLVKR